MPSLSFFSHLFWIAFLDDNERHGSRRQNKEGEAEGGPRAKKISRREKKRRTTSQKFSASLKSLGKKHELLHEVRGVSSCMRKIMPRGDAPLQDIIHALLGSLPFPFLSASSYVTCTYVRSGLTCE